MTAWFARTALLPGGTVAHDVRLEVDHGRFAAVTPGGTADGAQMLPGVVVPGFANGHSHAFHRALRGRTHDEGGTFWTWRRRMYELAALLDPDSYYALARATYAEMVLAGYTTVGEFHYLHHGPGGVRYVDPNAMGAALIAAAEDAGIRLTLLDACYLAGGLTPAGHLPLDDVQRRFADADVEAWAARQATLVDGPGVRHGVAVHSVRAVPVDALPAVAEAAGGRPVHAHLSEQPAENVAARGHYGRTPTELLHEAGVLGRGTTVVHANHLSRSDIVTLGSQSLFVCACPTTERDLADGLAPTRALADAGARLSVGSDQHAVVDPFEEVRGLESHERLGSLHRGRFAPAELLAAATRHDALGWDDVGTLAVGARADFVAVRDDSVRTAGARPEQLLAVASAADVDTVVIDGRLTAQGGRHVLGDVGHLLAEAIEGAWHRR